MEPAPSVVDLAPDEDSARAVAHQITRTPLLPPALDVVLAEVLDVASDSGVALRLPQTHGRSQTCSLPRRRAQRRRVDELADMSRPRSEWRVAYTPQVTFFKPRGVPLSTLPVTALSREEVEALRLKHVEGLEQRSCATHMGMSQSTFHRLLASAHAKVSTAVVRGTAISIESVVPARRKAPARARA